MTTIIRVTPSPAKILGIAKKHTTNAIRPYRVKKSSPCPICGKNSECIVIPEKQCIHVWCTRVASEYELKNWGFKGQAFYHRLAIDGTLSPIVQYVRQNSPLADNGTIDRILSYVAQLLPLTEAHKEKLAARGYDLASVGSKKTSRHMFASLPADENDRLKLAARLIMAGICTEEEILGTPGFQQDRRHKENWIAFLPTVPGTALIEFRRDASGNITGYQYAPDSPETDDKGKARKRLSPARMPISGCPHIARGIDDNGTECWHTEGIHKANLTADARNAIATGSLGAGNYGVMIEAIQQIDPKAQRLHILAIDSDQWASKNENSLIYKLHDAGYKVALARWDASLAKGPDDAIKAGLQIDILPWQDGRSKPREDRRITHAHQWQRDSRNQYEYLAAICNDLAKKVDQHIRSGNRDEVLIIAAPPGTGKSHKIAMLGATDTAGLNWNIGYIVPRHELVSSIEPLRYYQHIETANERNCPEAHKIHEIFTSKGLNTLPLHRQHLTRCEYREQFRTQCSKVYQTNHVRTTLLDMTRQDERGEDVKGHDAVIADEYDLATWLSEKAISIGDLRCESAKFAVDSAATTLITAIEAAISDMNISSSPCYGKDVFNAIASHCGNTSLEALLGQVIKDERATNTRPWIELDIYQSDALEQAERYRKIALPFIVNELVADLARWQKGQQWNSRIRIGPYTKHEYGLFITQPIEFSNNIGPLTILDATADNEIYSRVFNKNVKIVRPDVIPPSTMQHIAIRTGKRYGKTALTSSHGRDVARAAAEARYLLREIDHNSEKLHAGKIGLITFSDIENELGEMLGIPEHRRGHFWGIRGSNVFSDCDILLVIGTPTLRPDQVLRMARAIYHDDPEPINELVLDEDGHQFMDPRVQHLAEYLTRSELTQCAHRNRPLRFDNRLVVTFCNSEIDYLPATTEITSMPFLDISGEKKVTKRQTELNERMMQAVETLQSQGESITVRAVAAIAHVSIRDASPWLRDEQATQPEQKTDEVITEYDPDVEPWPRWQRVEHWKMRGLNEYEAIRKERAERAMWAHQKGAS